MDLMIDWKLFYHFQDMEGSISLFKAIVLDGSLYEIEVKFLIDPKYMLCPLSLRFHFGLAFTLSRPVRFVTPFHLLAAQRNAFFDFLEAARAETTLNHSIVLFEFFFRLASFARKLTYVGKSICPFVLRTPVCTQLIPN